MSPEELKARVDAVIARGENDDEVAHVEEDKLHMDLIDAFCPDWVVAEVARMTAANFCRWYA